MQPLKRIIYGIKVIVRSANKKEQHFRVTYYYFVQAVKCDEHVSLNEEIYNKIPYSDDAIRYLDIISCDEIDPEDSDYALYHHLYETGDIKEFHKKHMLVFKFNEVIN